MDNSKSISNVPFYFNAAVATRFVLLFTYPLYNTMRLPEVSPGEDGSKFCILYFLPFEQ